MYPEDLTRWGANPINAKLVQFLIEKTKHALSPISIQKLAAEFRHILDPSESCDCVSRIATFRSKIYYLDNVDSETKVKLLFVLSAPVNVKSIRSRIEGTFRFDDKKRIIYYESIDGKLKLEGSHDPRRKEGAYETSQKAQILIEEFFANREKPINGQLPKENKQKKEFWKFINFIFEKCKNISSPLIRFQFYEEYNTLYRLTKCRSGLETRIKVYCQEIQNLKSLDTRTKVRQLFGLGASLTEDCLEELRQHALVKLDDRERIIEYKSKDGSLSLQGKHDAISKSFVNRSTYRTQEDRFVQLPAHVDGENLEEDSEEELSNGSDDGIESDDNDHRMSNEDNEDETNSDEEETEVSVKNKRLSRRQRRPDNDDFLDDSGTPDFQSTSSSRTARCSSRTTCSERTSSIQNINTPLKTSNKRKTDETSTDTQKRARKSNNAESNVPPSEEFGLGDLEDYDPNLRRNNVNNDEEIQVGPRTIDASNIPETSENPRPVVPIEQEPEELVQLKKETITEDEEVKPTLSSSRCSVLQVLQALRTLVISLDNPSFESLQKEIEEKIKHFEGSGTSIPNIEVGLAMELCFSKMNNSSYISSSESSSFSNLRDFFCYLKSFILNLKIEELKPVMEKVNGCMKNCQNKRVRVKKVEEILRVTLDNITI